MRKFLFFFSVCACLSFLISLSAFSQNDSLVFYPVSNPVLQQYDIRSISAGEDGKLWLTTGNGLLSYDGSDIQVFLPVANDSTSLSGHSLNKTFMDKHGNLYAVIIADGQIDYFNTKSGKAERFKLHIEREDSSLYNLRAPVADILIDDDNNIWCGRPDMGFIHYNRATKKTKNYSLLSSLNTTRNSVNSIRKDLNNQNLLWLGTQDGMYSFNKKTNQLNRNFKCTNFLDSMQGDINLTTIDLHHKDTIWFGCREGRGMGFYDIKTGTYTIYPIDQEVSEQKSIFINSMQYLNSDEYLLAIEDRLPVIFNTKTKIYTPILIATEDHIPQHSVYHVLKDSSGKIWCLSHEKLFLARSRDNLLQITPIHDQYYKDRFRNAFRNVIWDENKKVYYAAFNMSDGIFVFDKDINLVRTIPAPQYKNPILGYIEALVVDIGLDKYGRLWLTGDRLSLYDSTKQRMIPIIEIHPALKSLNQRLRNLVFRDDFLYALSANWSSQYLYRLNLTDFTCDSILLSDIPIVEKQQPVQLGPLEMDSKGELLYMSNKNVVFQYNLNNGKTRKIIELTDLDKPYAHLPNFRWYNVDDNDDLWVSSLTKTWIFEPQNLKIIDSFEREVHTWFKQSSNLKGQGIMFFTNSTSQDLYDYKNGKHYKLNIKDGIVVYDNHGASYADNMLFIGYDDFMQYIPLSSIIGKGINRSCYLSKIQIFNQPYVTDSIPEHLHTLKLAHDDNYITLTFSSTEFYQPEKLEYRYKLDGVNDDWVYAGYLNRTVSYTNLHPGSYTFHASVKNDDGSWSENELNLAINIIPAWWQTTWFKIASIIAACIIAFMLIRWRIRTVRKQEQQKAKAEKELFELEAKSVQLKHEKDLEQKEAEKLKSIDKMKEKFFTNITHELRTPLSLILSPAEFYLQHPEELNDVPKLLGSMRSNSAYLLDLINQLLDISRLDAGKMNASLSKGDFGNYIKELLKTFEEQAQKKQIALHFENDLPGEFLFDAEHWKKIFNNLLGNALKFTPSQGEIYVSIARLSASADTCTTQLSVRDTGIGINKDDIPHITDRFYQADQNLTRKYEGTGIGLSLVNELVKLMNGTLEINSEVGKGSTFTATATLSLAQGKEGFPELLPLTTSVQFSNGKTIERHISKTASENIPLVLVVEDNAELKEFLQNSIESMYRVITASDGSKGFEIAISEIPDLIISDVMMPVMDGFEFCDKIKTNTTTSHIPFIILSAKNTFESKLTGLQKGADDYLTKPFSVDELLSKIKNILDRGQSLRAMHEKELLELEAKALSAQMNPHFIFNCMNSIKALVQKKEDEKAIIYLTTFSKLIRTIFQNSDKREISLHDEIETCRLYTQLESMRFGTKLFYSFEVDPNIDMKSITVPTLILQPFIENAIWHGIMPKEEGGTIHVTISKREEKIYCVIEDDGIGRKISMQHKMNGSSSTHQSKGVRLTQTRLELSNVLNERNATVEIIDKTNGKDEPAGTKVTLVFNEE